MPRGSKLSRAPTFPHQRPEPPRPTAWTAPAFPVASGWSRWWRGLVRCFRQNLHPSRIGRSGGKKKGKPRNHALSRCATINCPFLVLVHCRIGSSEITRKTSFASAAVHCRIGSSEIGGARGGGCGAVHCRIGSSEMRPNRARWFLHVHCRIGSSEKSSAFSPFSG